MRPNIAILASGSGTTAEAFIRAGQRGEITSRVSLVIVSRADAGIFERIDNLNKEFGLDIKTLLISNKTHPAADQEQVKVGYQTKAEEAAMLEALSNGNFDLVACMGYMKHVGASIVEKYGWRADYTSMYQAMMLNTHPGILPDTAAYYGVRIQQYVLDNGLPYAGQTVHIVSEEYDEGPIIAEHQVPVEPGDTADILFGRVQATEKKHLPGDIEAFVQGRLAYNKHKAGGNND
jgi:phosphoribosylglycinamide formyltransferase-1